ITMGLICSTSRFLSYRTREGRLLISEQRRIHDSFSGAWPRSRRKVQSGSTHPSRCRTADGRSASRTSGAFSMSDESSHSTETCKNEEPACRGWKDDPTPSPRRAELALRYNTARTTRNDGPEDSSLAERCLIGGL